MTHVSLFTGIGGLDLAAEWAGFETVLQVEREPFPLKVLEKHWPNVPRITDVREVTSESVRGDVTVISGGFPCQPFSAAGKRRDTDDDRYLWPELLRIVEELRPSWVVGENVSGLLSIRDGMEIDDMLASLEARNYEPWILHYPAAGVGAPHKRDRVFIVAHAERRRGEERRQGRDRKSGFYSQAWNVADPTGQPGRLHARSREEGQRAAHTERGSKAMANASGQRPQIGQRQERQRPYAATTGGDWWTTEPDVGRVAHGVPRRVERLKALGNAVVPQQAYPIFKAIASVEADRLESRQETVEGERFGHL